MISRYEKRTRRFIFCKEYEFTTMRTETAKQELAQRSVNALSGVAMKFPLCFYHKHTYIPTAYSAFSLTMLPLL